MGILQTLKVLPRRRS